MAWFKPFPILSFLLSAVLLSACGVAEDDNPVEENTDTLPPSISAIKIDGQTVYNGYTIPLKFKTVEVVFTEQISFSSQSGDIRINKLDGSLIDGSWSYDSASNSVTFTHTGSLDPQSSYVLNISTKIADKAGNHLARATSFTFQTLQSYAFSVKLNHLKGNLDLSVNDQTPVSLTGTGSYVLPEQIEQGLSVTLTVGANSSEGQSCQIPGSVYFPPVIVADNPATTDVNEYSYTPGYFRYSFTMPATSDSVDLYCHDVTPLYSDAPRWNDYLKPGLSTAPAFDSNTADGIPSCDGSNDSSCQTHVSDACSNLDTERCVHGGVMRSFVVPASSGITSCTGVTVSETTQQYSNNKLNAVTFADGVPVNSLKWACQESGDGRVRVYSTGLNNGSRLADLLSFNASNPGWYYKQVTVSDGSNSASSGLGPWWNNPVQAQSNACQGESRIYLLASSMNNLGGNVAAGCQIMANKVAVVVKRGDALYGSFYALGSSLNPLRYLWIEGDLNPTGHTNSSYLAGVYFDTVFQSHVSNININASSYGSRIQSDADVRESGIFLRNSVLNDFDNISIHSVSHYGLRISNSSSFGEGNRFSNLSIVDVASSGMFIEGNNNRFQNLTVAFTGFHALNAPNNGITVYSGADERIEAISLFAADKTILNNVSVYNNASHGIADTATKRSHDVIFSNVNVSGNDGDGIQINGSNALLSHVSSINNLGSGINLVNDYSHSIFNSVSGLNGVSDTLQSTDAAQLISATQSDISETGRTLLGDSSPHGGLLIDINERSNVITASDHLGNAWVNGVTSSLTSGACDTTVSTGGAGDDCVHLDVSYTGTSAANTGSSSHTLLDGNTTITIDDIAEVELSGNGDGLCQTGETCSSAAVPGVIIP